MTEQTPSRTYGGWRRSRGVGLIGLGPAQTLILLAAITILVIAATLRPGLLLFAAPPCLVVVGLVLLRWDGVPLHHGLVRRTRWMAGRSRRQTSYRSGVMVAGEHAWALPGVLAGTTLLRIADPAGDFGLVHHQRLHTLTATLRCAATSTWLADPEQTTTWVANWGSWLAGLGYLPMVRWVTVTVESAPDPGTRLADHLAERVAATSPLPARRILHELVEVSPAAAADVATRVSLTFDPAASPARHRRLGTAVEEISHTLPGLTDSLATCGLTVLGRATAEQITAAVRTAYDPTVRGDIELLAARQGPTVVRWLDWDTAGPVMAEEHVDWYQHDAAASVTWAWHEAPRQPVHADVLSRLLAPGPFPKRVSLLYRPLPAGEAARVVEREVTAAAFRTAYHRAQKRDESARDHADRIRALQSAREEATGAGVGLMSLFVTVTVTDPNDLARAVADIESRADVAKIRLRRLRGSQSAGFATTLPCGICPPQLARHWPR